MNGAQIWQQQLQIGKKEVYMDQPPGFVVWRGEGQLERMCLNQSGKNGLLF